MITEQDKKVLSKHLVIGQEEKNQELFNLFDTMYTNFGNSSGIAILAVYQYGLMQGKREERAKRKNRK